MLASMCVIRYDTYVEKTTLIKKQKRTKLMRAISVNTDRMGALCDKKNRPCKLVLFGSARRRLLMLTVKIYIDKSWYNI